MIKMRVLIGIVFTLLAHPCVRNVVASARPAFMVKNSALTLNHLSYELRGLYIVAISLQYVVSSSSATASTLDQPPVNPPKVPQSPPQWDHTPDQIIQITQDAIAISRKAMDTIGNLPEENCTFESVVLALANDEASLSLSSAVGIYDVVSPDEALRTASTKVSRIMSEYEIEVVGRPDIYRALRAAEKNTDMSLLDLESQRLFQSVLRERVRNGLDLSPSDQQKMRDLKTASTNLGIDFQNNLNGDVGKLWFSLQELKGVPENVLSGFEKGPDGKLAMTFKTPDLNPVTTYAINPETRKRASIANDSRAKANVPILEQILEIRREIARLLGKPNYATHAEELMMAKNPANVEDFLDHLSTRVRIKAESERTKLLELKHSEVAQLNLDTDPRELYNWDVGYYARLYAEKTLALNMTLVQEYFPVSHVIDAIIETYQTLLSGHAFHQMCSQTRYARFHGTAVTRDFVEAPSQMLENWCWTESQLLRLSQHYQRKEDKMPKELIKKLIISRDLTSGMSTMAQVFYAQFDMHVHTAPRPDRNLTLTWSKMKQQIALVNSTADSPPGQSTFGHLVGGYAAAYYGYLYSQVFSADMFATVFAADPLSPVKGKHYRQEILKPGGSRDEMESLTRFLSRPPNDEAFMTRLLASGQPPPTA